MVKFDKVQEWHIDHVAENMRDQDVAEIKASNGCEPYEGLKRSVQVSDYSVCILYDNEPVAILGLTIVNIIAGMGIPWMLGTDQVTHHGKTLSHHTSSIINDMLKITPKMYNYVHSKNTVSIRWLKKVGFQIDKKVEHHLFDKNESFYKFTLGFNNV